jgi:hypothetical protein
LISIVWDIKGDVREIKNELSKKVDKSDCVKESEDMWNATNELRKLVWGKAKQ